MTADVLAARLVFEGWQVLVLDDAADFGGQSIAYLLNAVAT